MVPEHKGHADVRLDGVGDVLNPYINYTSSNLAMNGILGDFALLSLPNNFQQVNFIPGIRLEAKTVTEDYTLTVVDFGVYVDASAGPVQIFLPPALGYRAVLSHNQGRRVS
jgi:hypothetical protein